MWEKQTQRVCKQLSDKKEKKTMYDLESLEYINKKAAEREERERKKMIASLKKEGWVE